MVHNSEYIGCLPLEIQIYFMNIDDTIDEYDKCGE